MNGFLANQPTTSSPQTADLTESFIEIGYKLQTQWEEANKHFVIPAVSDPSKGGSSSDSDTQDSDYTLALRWMTDVYADLALLTARVWAKVGAFERVEHVAQQTHGQLKLWVESWQDHYSDTHNDNWFTFSPWVFRYQRAGLLAWDAYAKYQMLDHLPDKATSAPKIEQSDVQQPSRIGSYSGFN